ncbi:MAG: hypothetical protein AB7G20_02070 [Sulfurimonas sp.]
MLVGIASLGDIFSQGYIDCLEMFVSDFIVFNKMAQDEMIKRAEG